MSKASETTDDPIVPAGLPRYYQLSAAKRPWPQRISSLAESEAVKLYVATLEAKLVVTLRVGV